MQRGRCQQVCRGQADQHVHQLLGMTGTHGQVRPDSGAVLQLGALAPGAGQLLVDGCGLASLLGCKGAGRGSLQGPVGGNVW